MTKALIFSGQGAQKVGMGADFYEGNEAVRELWDSAQSAIGLDVKRVAFEGPEEVLTETRFCQPALYLHGLSVYETLKSRGHIKDEEVGACFGLSIGELTALAVAGVYDYETGLKIVAKRGALMQQACEETDGAMAAIVGGEPEKVRELCASCDIDVANFNCPGQIVISGSSAGVEKAIGMGKVMGFKRVVPLAVAGAYHSRLMGSAAEGFEAFLSEIEFKAPRFRVLTNVTGGEVSDPEAIKSMLVKQVVGSVLFEDCLRTAMSWGVNGFVECGVGRVLSGMVKRTDKEVGNETFGTLEEIEKLATA